MREKAEKVGSCGTRTLRFGWLETVIVQRKKYSSKKDLLSTHVLDSDLTPFDGWAPNRLLASSPFPLLPSPSP